MKHFEKKHYLDYETVSFPMQGPKSTNFTVDQNFATKKQLIENLMEEMKPVVMGDK